MPNDDKDDNQNLDDTSVTPSNDTKSSTDVKELDKLVELRVDERLKDIKENLNKAYGARDEALKKVKEFEEKERQREIERLKEEGKHREAYEKQLADERAAREALEKRNVELTRDMELKTALANLPFRNERSRNMAFKEIADQLIQNDNKDWVHRSGVSITDAVKQFSEADENSFLFTPKVSSGTGSSGSGKSTTVSGEKKSIFELSQEEVLKRAAEGTLRRST